MHLVALVESTEHVCCRYRLTAFRPFLERAGHHLEFLTRPRHVWQWLRLARRLARADAVILQRKLLPNWQLRLVRARSRFLIFDVDDAVFVRNSFSAQGFHSERRRRRFIATVQAADLIVAGNAFLADMAAQWAGRDPVQIIPTCVDADHYPLAEHLRPAGTAELVWIGSASTVRSLEAARPLLESLGRRWPGLHLKIICDRFPRFQHLPVVDCRWTQASEAAALATADIGLSWLPDDPWSWGKCGLKVLQCMAAGLPVVANPVGMHKELVRHGETGFLAEHPEEWAESIGQLMREPALRRRLGQAGRQRLEAHFSVGRGANLWMTLLRDVPALLRQRTGPAHAPVLPVTPLAAGPGAGSS